MQTVHVVQPCLASRESVQLEQIAATENKRAGFTVAERSNAEVSSWRQNTTDLCAAVAASGRPLQIPSNLRY
jgi:hypothetical protein